MVLPLINNIGRTGVITFLCRITDSPSITIRSITMSSRKHRLVWSATNGPIPKDENGRSYEIHHLDGNHNNNDISNLKLVTIQEHYNIHLLQEDWNACKLIALRMNIDPKEISRLSSLGAKQRIENGTHHFLKGGPREDLIGDKNPMRNPEVAKKVSDKVKGKPKTRTEKRIQADLNRIGIKLNYTEDGLKRQQENGRKKFTLNNPSKIKVTCEHCNKVVDKGNFTRWHGNNCRSKE